MNDQSGFSPLPPLPQMPGTRPNNAPVMPILIGVLGLGAVIFAILTIHFYNTATTATKTLNEQKKTAATAARADQKKADEQAATLANESPYRSYVAPVAYGSFEIKFPKNWSSYVDQEQSGTQVSLALNPDFVRHTNGSDDLMATRVQLIERTSTAFTQNLSGPVKQGTLKQSDTTVSGLQAIAYAGTFPDRKTSRMIVVPVRDKVIVFTNENNKYNREFDEIIAQSKIVP